MLESLRHATHDLSWLLTHGYAVASSLKIVGDRYRLTRRQRLAVQRSACSERAREHRVGCRLDGLVDGLAGGHSTVWLDGFNVLTTVEAALSGGMILQGQDSCFRDLASMHGSYRRVEETQPAIELVGRHLGRLGASQCCWWLDQPVSNSGRLQALLQQTARQHGWDWQVNLVPDPDRILSRTEHVVATSDSQILDCAPRWLNLAREVITGSIPTAWIVDLSQPLALGK